MSVSIYQKIEEKGRNEVNSILEEANQKANDLKLNLVNEAKNKANELISIQLKKNEDLIKSTKTSLDQKTKQAILAHKKVLINAFSNEVINYLISLNDEDAINYFKKLLSKTVFTGDELIKVSINDFERYQKLFKSMESNFNTKFNFSNDHVNIKGGFIIESSSYDLDFSFDTLVKDMTSEYETEIANLLFKEDVI